MRSAADMPPARGRRVFEGPRDRRRLRNDAFERTRAAGRRGMRARGRRRRAELRFEAAAAAAHAGGRVPPAGPAGGRLLRFRRRRLLRDGRLLRLRRDLRKRVGRARLSRTCDDAGARLLGRRRLLRGSGGLDLLGRLGLCPVGLLLHRFCLRHRSGVPGRVGDVVQIAAVGQGRRQWLEHPIGLEELASVKICCGKKRVFTRLERLSKTPAPGAAASTQVSTPVIQVIQVLRPAMYSGSTCARAVLERPADRPRSASRAQLSLVCGARAKTDATTLLGRSRALASPRRRPRENCSPRRSPR